MEDFGHHVDDRSRKAKCPGKQRILLMSGHVIPLQYRDGLPYFDQELPSDEDMETYEHVDMTSPADWDPSVLDNEIDIDDPDDPIHQETMQSAYDLHMAHCKSETQTTKVDVNVLHSDPVIQWGVDTTCDINGLWDMFNDEAICTADDLQSNGTTTFGAAPHLAMLHTC